MLIKVNKNKLFFNYLRIYEKLILINLIIILKVRFRINYEWNL